MANSFLCFHEQIWLRERPNEFKPVYNRRYVDNMFVLFCSHNHLEKFKNYLNSKRTNIKFTCKKEHNDYMPFLDVLTTGSSNGCKASLYHKSTFSRVYSNMNSFISELGLIFTLLVHPEVCHLKEILKKTHSLSN